MLMIRSLCRSTQSTRQHQVHYEIESNNSLSFLDGLVTRQSNEQIGQFIVSQTPKNKLNHLLAKGIYIISCSCGAIYIGQTGCSFQIRLSEQKGCLR